MRGAAVSTSSPGRLGSNMRDCAAIVSGSFYMDARMGEVEYTLVESRQLKVERKRKKEELGKDNAEAQGTRRVAQRTWR